MRAAAIRKKATFIACPEKVGVFALPRCSMALTYAYILCWSCRASLFCLFSRPAGLRSLDTEAHLRIDTYSA